MKRQALTNPLLKQFKLIKLLNIALLQDGKMAHALYEHELVEHIDYWYAGLKRDKEDYVFVVTENRGHIAMLLIDRDKNLYVNEAGRTKLSELWQKNYRTNIKRLIPTMADELANDILSVTGVKMVER